MFVGAVLMTLFCFRPFGHIVTGSGTVDLRPVDFPVFLILNIVIAALLLIAIFLYGNRRRQRMVTAVSMVLIVVSAVCGGILLYGSDCTSVCIEWFGGISMLIPSFIMAALAYQGIRHDQKLVDSLNHFR